MTPESTSQPESPPASPSVKDLPLHRLIVGTLIFMVLPAALWLGWRSWVRNAQAAAAAVPASVASTEGPSAPIAPEPPAAAPAPKHDVLASNVPGEDGLQLPMPKSAAVIPGPPGATRELSSTQGLYQVEAYLGKGPTLEESAKAHATTLKAAGFAVDRAPTATEGPAAQIVYFVRGHGRSATVVAIADEESGVSTTVMSTSEERQ